ncbi:hypothetical protein D3C87_1618600 [compost metagenome]
MWSALLSNSMNPQKDTFTDPSFIRLLNELSGLDARILLYLHAFEKRFKQYKRESKAVWDSLGGEDFTSTSVKEIKESEQRKRFDHFKAEAEKMREELVMRTTEEHISYSISNLARLGVIDIPSSVMARNNSLLTVHQDYRTNKVNISTQRLEQELADLRRRIGFGFASDKKLPKIASDGSGGNIPTPGYNLTEYGTRFLDACT